MAELYNDGNVPYGTQVVTMNSVTYVGESLEPTLPTEIVDRKNHINEPSGQVIIRAKRTLTGTLQLANTTTVLPPLGTTFNTTHQNVAYAWILTEVSPPEEQDGAKKVRFSAVEKINS